MYNPRGLPLICIQRFLNIQIHAEIILVTVIIIINYTEIIIISDISLYSEIIKYIDL